MDQNRFDAWTRLVTSVPSRRRFVRGLAAAGLGLGAMRLPDATAGKKRRKKKKAKPNAFGCLDVGKTCKNAEQCCSGICEGKKGKRKCQAHDTSLCTAEKNFCTAGVAAVCNGANVRAVCVQTTGKAAFCADLTDSGGDAICRVCARDVDCQEEFGPGAACVDLRGGICQGTCPDTGGTACVPSGAPTAA